MSKTETALLLVAVMIYASEPRALLQDSIVTNLLYFNLLKPTGYVKNHPVEHSRVLHSATLYLCVLY